VKDFLKIWYVAPQRLCNFHCSYCVSRGDYSKSNKINWKNPKDIEGFKKVINWISKRPFKIGFRLGSLGEPFTSCDFLDQVAWLTNQKNIQFVELLTNGSLLKEGLQKLQKKGAEFEKLSLWISYHPSQISLDKFIDNARFAQEIYKCFVVVNGIIFPDNIEYIKNLRKATNEYNLRFNLDLGYNPTVPSIRNDIFDIDKSIPILKHYPNLNTLIELGMNKKVLQANITAMEKPEGQLCSAGQDYIFIAINGDVYPCSSYCVLKHDKLGNILENENAIQLRPGKWKQCTVKSGCCNKEDFLNLKLAGSFINKKTRSLGWYEK
jgi:MoaA/NifB/PqqE/SkfB family radical SAM enzyme